METPKVVVCPICERQVEEPRAVVYKLISETFTYSEPFICYCKECHGKYALQNVVTHMGNKYRRLIPK